MSNETIVQCIGAGWDIQFPAITCPIYEASILVDEGSSFAEKRLTLEVQQQLGDGVVPSRWVPATGSAAACGPHRRTDLGARGPRHPGFHHDVLDRPIDEAVPIASDEKSAIHQPAPRFDELSPSVELLETGIKVIDLVPVRHSASACSGGAGGQDRQHDGTDQQHAAAHSGLSVRRRGERTREGNDFYHETEESNVWTVRVLNR